MVSNTQSCGELAINDVSNELVHFMFDDLVEYFRITSIGRLLPGAIIRGEGAVGAAVLVLKG
jgi:hypothetical protein